MRSILICATLALGACGDDDGATESGDIPAPRRFDQLKIPFTDGPACVSTFSKKHKDTSPITSCRCNACLELMQECEAVQGCTEIVACSNETGCNDEWSCYLLPTARCAETIDKWGNSSLATAISLEILACSMTNNCR